MRRTRELLALNALLLGLVALILVFALLNERFLSIDNFRNLLQQSAVIATVAVPTALLLIAGKVDLSIGSTLALGGVTCGLLLANGTPVLVAVAAGIAAGAVVGLLNGLLVTALELSPIIVTLGILTAGRGLALVISPDPLFNFGSTFEAFGQGRLVGVPYLVLVAATVAAVGGAVLAFAPLGRHIYAVGVNEEAAYLSGVRVKRVVLGLYVVSGAAAALGGVMLAARIGSAPSGALGVGFELDVLTAVLLGGVAFDGGRGRVSGVLLGVLFLAVLGNGLTLENVPASVAALVKGLVLVVAAGLDRIASRAPSGA
jgi:ribose/xylose/arabinose/galactoside ABC-type transport system permease subunit